MGDATKLPFCSEAVNDALIAFVSHHLPDPLIDATIQEADRVCVRKLIFLDGLKVPGRVFSNLLWRYDRGQFPRSDSELIAKIRQRFIIQRTEYLSIFHKYLIVVATKKST
jgi:hypothetical protein